MLTDSTISIGLLLPDVLGTYSDAGNAAVLAQRLRWRGISAHIHMCTATETPSASCEIYLVGGGEDTAQLFAADWLRRHDQLRHTMENRSITLAICAGLQILGHTMADTSGRQHPGLGMLDVTTTPMRRRAIGEIVSECHIPNVGRLTGFENHRGATILGPDAPPLGRVLSGSGNGDRRRGWRSRPATEGVRTDRIIATYLHGPVLARNPALADHILALAVGTPLPALDLPDQQALRRTYL